MEKAESGADVVFPGVDGLFSYRVPPRCSSQAAPGVRVLAPFGRRRTTGTIVAISRDPSPKATRPIEHLLDSKPVFSPALLKLTAWMSDYYFCPWGDVLKAALPAGISLDETRQWVLNIRRDQVPARWTMDAQARELMDVLGAAPIGAERMRSRFGLRSAAPLLRRMQEAGLISFRPVLRPPRVKSRFDSMVLLSERTRPEYSPEWLGGMRSIHEQHLVREVFEAGPDGVLRTDLLRGSGSARRQAFSRLLASGVLELRVEPVTRWDPRSEITPETVEPSLLTEEQTHAVGEITSSLDRGRFEPFLLFGVTGSGKTQVYIEAIRHVLGRGKSALVLLPEIALTPFVWGRFYRAFGDRVAIQHSGQSPAVRYDLWRDIAAGKYPVVVGARSAVFAPLDRLALIVVDEEQEATYKQEEPDPRYHARDAALVRARMENAVIVLGSATPSVESFRQAMEGKYRLLRLPHRVGGAAMPEVRLIIRTPAEAIHAEAEEKGKRKARARVSELPVLSEELQQQIAQTLAQGKQVILLQNRRGFSPFLLCRDCSKVPCCPNCSVSLTYHRKGWSLRCHYCDHRESVPDVCPRCGSANWIAEGLGTQRLEEELSVHFPQARILRMDSDTASRRGIHGKMVTAFAAGKYDLLVGTQMIAKGLDFPGVQLAVVAQAETELLFPDFRSSERGAALILQVAGRAGRREETGRVVIQSLIPEHPVLDTAVRADWEELVNAELRSRASSLFPPYARLILLRGVSRNESAAARAMLRFRRLLQQAGGVDVLGPAPAVVAKMRGQYRMQMLVRTARDKDSSGNRLRAALRQALTEFKRAGGEPGVQIEVDVDPQTVL